MAGRNTLCTPELIKKICEYISKGNYANIACELVGIGESTFYQWLDRAERDYDNGLDSSQSIFIEFAESLKRANAQLEDKVVTSVLEKSLKNPNPVFSYIFLQRRARERWSDKTQYDVDREADTIVNRLAEALRKPELIEGECKEV